MERFSLKVLVISASSVESARILIFLSSISRNVSLKVVPAESISNMEGFPFAEDDFDLLIFDLKCVANNDNLRDLIGNHAKKIMFLSVGETGEKVILDFPPGQAVYVRKPITYHTVADGFAQIGINLRKLNCWEYNLCGRGPGQVEESGLEICPVGTETVTSGMNEGAMGGRVCWAIGGSFCAGEKQGTFASKIMSCQECDFYKLVHEEQGQYAESINSILGRMKYKKEE